MELDEIKTIEAEAEEEIQVKIYRYHPDKMNKPRYDKYKVPFIKGMSIGNVLEYIRKKLDRNLAYYLSCRTGKCQECLIRVNNKPVRPCTEPAKADMKIEPLNENKVIKDLITS